MNSLPPSVRRAGVLPVLAAALTLAGSASADVLINEMDCDQVGTDAGEFVEFYNTDTVNAAIRSTAMCSSSTTAPPISLTSRWI